MNRSVSLASLLLTAGTLPSLAYDPIISLEGQHATVTPAVQTIQILAGAAQTDGKLGMIIIEGKAGEGPGPSITHSKESETWYVLEGTYEFHVGTEVIEGGPGTFISVDSGQPHGFVNKTDGRLLIVFTPGGYEEFFAEWDAKDLQRGPELGALERSYGVTRPAP
jgi:quercetin dioxygenase-like cupin family protein